MIRFYADENGDKIICKNVSVLDQEKAFEIEKYFSIRGGTYFALTFLEEVKQFFSSLYPAYTWGVSSERMAEDKIHTDSVVFFVVGSCEQKSIKLEIHVWKRIVSDLILTFHDFTNS